MASPWLPSESARALPWWDARGLARVASELDAVTGEWCAAWALRPAPAATCRALEGTAPRLENCEVWLSTSGAPAAWLQQDEAGLRDLQADLFGGTACGTPLAQSVAAACVADWTARLAVCLGLRMAATHSMQPMVAGPGAVQADFAGLRLVIGAEAAARWQRRSMPPQRGSAAPLVRIDQALTTRTLTFGVHLEGCELPLGSVRGLRVGDVVRIAHALEVPARLADESGATAFRGYLGRQGARKAVELVPQCVS